MFDSRSKLRIPIDDDRKIRLSFPGDALWCERVRRSKVIRQNVGGDEWKSDTPNLEAASAELIAACRVDGGDPPINVDEAVAAAQALESCDAGEISKDGRNYVIPLKVMGGIETVHVLAAPSIADIRKYTKASFGASESYRKRTIGMLLEPAGELYDKLKVSVEGYAEGSAIPIIHKEAALSEVIRLEESKRKVEILPE